MVYTDVCGACHSLTSLPIGTWQESTTAAAQGDRGGIRGRGRPRRGRRDVLPRGAARGRFAAPSSERTSGARCQRRCHAARVELVITKGEARGRATSMMLPSAVDPFEGRHAGMAGAGADRAMASDDRRRRFSSNGMDERLRRARASPRRRRKPLTGTSCTSNTSSPTTKHRPCRRRSDERSSRLAPRHDLASWPGHGCSTRWPGLTKSFLDLGGRSHQRRSAAAWWRGRSCPHGGASSGWESRLLAFINGAMAGQAVSRSSPRSMPRALIRLGLRETPPTNPRTRQ